jgi:hypothetical protein
MRAYDVLTLLASQTHQRNSHSLPRPTGAAEEGGVWFVADLVCLRRESVSSPDSRRGSADFHEIELQDQLGLAMLRKGTVAFLACAALYIAFAAYSRRQVWLAVLLV